MSSAALKTQKTLNSLRKWLKWDCLSNFGWFRQLIHISKPALNPGGGVFERRGRLLSREGPTKDNTELHYGKCFCSLSHSEDEKPGYRDLCCFDLHHCFFFLRHERAILNHPWPFPNQTNWWGQRLWALCSGWTQVDLRWHTGRQSHRYAGHMQGQKEEPGESLPHSLWDFTLEAGLQLHSLTWE